ncbi:putative ABC transporter ATP-binding protein [Bacteroides thetaiotaomicron VPI-5482]|uniref:ABC transporter ATP-binding protein n=8 Tax=Bacteroides thetaiotaomicron TaxID=818 RepID=Q8A0G9_BACTN|nr:putative ABC transporter ATP-binding protein [Bacteroides thetaiotaomicron VPI-5482]
MEQQADYIRRIEIKGLWARFNIQWDLRPDVNILSGINGVGKTTILNRSVGYLEQLSGDIQLSGEMKSDAKNGVHLFFDNPAATYIPYDVIRSYDRPLIMGDFTARMADKNVKSELDWQLYLLQRRYLDYQVNIGNKMIEMLSSNDEEQRSKAATLSLAKRRFQDMIDELFSYTRKKIDRRRNDIAFYQDGELLFPYKLSSGEKQMLVILLTVLVQDNSHCVLFMDEPEASLHIEWQQKLISMIRELNPNVQIILTTHSPAVIMEGWLDAVTEVSDISTEADGFRLPPTINVNDNFYMATSLRDNLTSSYFNAAHKLYSKKARRRIIAYVESYDDVAFWRTLLEEFEDDEHYFQVMLPSATSLAKGKKMVLMNTLNTAELGRSLIACVDSDYDFLLQGATNTSRKINRNKYIFQTYTYAIENYHCFAESLHEVCVQATLNDRFILDFNAYLKRYSEIVYPLFLWNVWFYRQRDTYTFPMYDFHTYTALREISLKHPEHSLEALQHRVNQKLAELKKRFPGSVNQVNGLRSELKELGLVPETTYLYMQGHHVMDNVVMKLLIPVCTALRREREQEIKRLAEHNEQFRNELTCYQNSQVNVEIMLKKNVAYKRLFHYDWLRQDIQEYLAKGE